MRTEQCVSFDCQGESLLGLLSLPAAQTQTCVLIVVGGPQYRAGSHRMFVQLARQLAAAGYAAFRFDVRGMGDSSGSQRSFESLGDDIASALDAVQAAHPSLSRFVLWGLCDGASASLLYLHGRPDPRVAGLCLANPWVRSEASLARTQVKHYYVQRLLDRSFWAKLLRGGVGLSAGAELLKSVGRAARRSPAASSPGAVSAGATFQDRMASAWARFGGPVCVLLSGRDYTAKEFLTYAEQDPRFAALLVAQRTVRESLPEADHTFSGEQETLSMAAATLRWLESTSLRVSSP